VTGASGFTLDPDFTTIWTLITGSAQKFGLYTSFTDSGGNSYMGVASPAINTSVADGNLFADGDKSGFGL
jgi:hypothetical protein